MASTNKRNFNTSAIRSQIIISIDEHCMVNAVKWGIKELDKDFDGCLVRNAGP